MGQSGFQICKSSVRRNKVSKRFIIKNPHYWFYQFVSDLSTKSAGQRPQDLKVKAGYRLTCFYLYN
jgi:hypothetical protein